MPISIAVHDGLLYVGEGVNGHVCVFTSKFGASICDIIWKQGDRTRKVLLALWTSSGQQWSIVVRV